MFYQICFPCVKFWNIFIHYSIEVSYTWPADDCKPLIVGAVAKIKASLSFCSFSTNAAKFAMPVTYKRRWISWMTTSAPSQFFVLNFIIFYFILYIHAISYIHIEELFWLYCSGLCAVAHKLPFVQWHKWNFGFQIFLDIQYILHKQHDDGNQRQKGDHHLVYLNSTQCGDVESHECDTCSVQWFRKFSLLYFLWNIQ